MYHLIITLVAVGGVSSRGLVGGSWGCGCGGCEGLDSSYWADVLTADRFTVNTQHHHHFRR